MTIASAAAISAAASAAFVASASPLAATEVQYTPRENVPIVCTEQYAPVCGRVDNVTRTFPNACHARAARAEIVAEGPCGGAPARPIER